MPSTPQPQFAVRANAYPKREGSRNRRCFPTLKRQLPGGRCHGSRRNGAFTTLITASATIAVEAKGTTQPDGLLVATRVERLGERQAGSA